MSFVNSFDSWLRVNEDQEIPIDVRIRYLRRLVDLGLVSIDELKAALRTKDAFEILSDDDIYREIISSPEYKEFKELGLDIVSSPRQLRNRTLVIAYPTYLPSNQFAIGFFPATRIIKRMFPQGIRMGVYGREFGSMDFRIKEFPEGSFKDDLSFYLKGMRWVLDHIDFEKTDFYSNTPYFPVKKRTSKTYFKDIA